MTNEQPQIIEASVPARIRGSHRHSFRRGEVAEIIGVRFLNRNDLTPCFMALFKDGVINYWPIEDTANYEIVR